MLPTTKTNCLFTVTNCSDANMTISNASGFSITIVIDYVSDSSEPIAYSLDELVSQFMYNMARPLIISPVKRAN